MKTKPTLRHETADDLPGIRRLVHDAFGRPGEADLVDALRCANALSISAVADYQDRIIGHVAFSRVTIGDGHSALALAPVAVLPECQRQGIGSQLIRWALDECRASGHGIILVLGSPAYYARFGFTSAISFGIMSPFPCPAENYMLLELSSGAIKGCVGKVRYPPEFDSV